MPAGLSNEVHGYGYFPYGIFPYGRDGAIAGGNAQGEFLIGQESFNAQGSIIKPASFNAEGVIQQYNATNLRILCSFPSRGRQTQGGGNNAFGNEFGSGQNWQATSTQASDTNDFDVLNVNTDLTEQVFRTAVGVSGVTLTCDTEDTGDTGTFVDTLAILNHNFSSSANITFQGSDDFTFTTIPLSIQIQSSDDGATVYIAPELPTIGYRYYRIIISDSTKTASEFLEIGTIVFGSGIIFNQECFVDKVVFEPVNYVDTVKTEGFSNVRNDRGVKNKLKLEFKSLDFNKTNFTKIKGVFNDARTILKCLWIPTPEFPKRFMVFSKLTKIPKETHNVKGELSNYVDFTIELDEAL